LLRKTPDREKIVTRLLDGVRGSLEAKLNILKMQEKQAEEQKKAEEAEAATKEEEEAEHEIEEPSEAIITEQKVKYMESVDIVGKMAEEEFKKVFPGKERPSTNEDLLQYINGYFLHKSVMLKTNELIEKEIGIEQWNEFQTAQERNKDKTAEYAKKSKTDKVLHDAKTKEEEEKRILAMLKEEGVSDKDAQSLFEVGSKVSEIQAQVSQYQALLQSILGRYKDEALESLKKMQQPVGQAGGVVAQVK